MVLIIPSVAFASWWNPISWFNNWTFNKQEVIPQKQEGVEKNPEEKINELQKQLDELKSQQLIPSSSEPITEIKKNISTTTDSSKIIKTTQVVDVCLNIDGIQTKTPDGYSWAYGNICSVIDLTDYCPNINGIQSKIPDGKFLYKNTNQCLTENEIEKLEDISSKEAQEKAQKLQIESLCLSNKEKVVNLRKELSELYLKFQKDYDYMNNNSGGMLQSGLNDQLNKLDQKYNSDQNTIYSQINIAQAEVQLYCN